MFSQHHRLLPTVTGHIQQPGNKNRINSTISRIDVPLNCCEFFSYQYESKSEPSLYIFKLYRHMNYFAVEVAEAKQQEIFRSMAYTDGKFI